MKKGKWGTRLGFYFAAIGTSIGLGNLWRFPYVVVDNGGGAFVWLYLTLVFFVGIPLLVAEILLGKITGKSLVGAVKDIQKSQGNKGIKINVGKLAMVICFVVLAYYAVISGWVLHFLIQFGGYFFIQESFNSVMVLEALRANGWLQVSLTLLHLILVVVVVAKDVEEGIEKFVGFALPIFSVLLVIIVIKNLSLDTAPEAIRYLLYPNFSQLKISSLGHAVGHVFFTLSIGFGMMVTFGSYLKENSNVTVAGYRVAILDTLVALIAGLIVFPLIVLEDGVKGGPLLLFETIPTSIGSPSARTV